MVNLKLFKRDEGLTFTSINQDFRERVQAFLTALKGKSKDPLAGGATLFVIDYRPPMSPTAENRNLRQEITSVLLVAKPGDTVLVRLESAPGGTVTGFGHAASQLLRLRAAKLKLVVSIDEIAASGGYMCACVAEQIIAAPFSLIGSIGVVMEFPNFAKAMERLGIRWVQLAAGEFKRTLSPFTEETPIAREVQAERIQKIFAAFKRHVSEHRQERLQIERVANGDTWLAEEARDLGLIDDIETSDNFIMRAIGERDMNVVHVKYKEPDKNGIVRRLLAANLTTLRDGLL